MAVGDGATPGRSRPDVEPWPSAAQRAAARRLAGQPGTARMPAGNTPAEPSRAEPVVPRTARPRIEDDPGLLGFTRRSNSRLGSRLFALFFVAVFVLILAQMVVVLLGG